MWNDGDEISVQIGDGTPGIYYINADGSVDMPQSTPAYWRTTDKGQSITAWYVSPSATTDGILDITDQSAWLKYVMQATDTADFNTPVSLHFSHQVAKVRVIVGGTQAADVQAMDVFNYTKCTSDKGSVSAADADKGWIKMHKTSYDGNTTAVYEANVVPGAITPNNFIRGNGGNMATISGITELTAGNLHTINLTVGDPVIDINDYEGTTITIARDTYIKGNGEAVDKQIVIQGDIEVTLDNVSISTTNSPGISITDGNPTLKVSGTGNTVTSATTTAIDISGGATATIEGNSGTTDKLTAAGGAITKNNNYFPGPAIGTSDGGNIVIRNVTVDATGGTAYVNKYISYGAAAIGSYNSNCGNITIQNAIITDKGGRLSPAIGLGHLADEGTYTLGDILIESSTITATGGGAWSLCNRFPLFGI